MNPSRKEKSGSIMNRDRRGLLRWGRKLRSTCCVSGRVWKSSSSVSLLQVVPWPNKWHADVEGRVNGGSNVGGGVISWGCALPSLLSALSLLILLLLLVLFLVVSSSVCTVEP